MKYKEYKEISGRLQTPADIKALAKAKGLDEELLMVLYTQNVVRDATRKFYRVKKRAPKMLHMWRGGNSFCRIAGKFSFPPVLTAMLIMQENRISRKRFWKMVLKPEGVRDNRLRRELVKACKADLVYSPDGIKRQRDRGRWGEAKLHEWLDKRSIEYDTEAELRGRYRKTPDALFAKPLRLNGSDRVWIESKATFGDPFELKRHVKKQLEPYLSMFGEGLVVYWFGYVEDARVAIPDGVSVVDGRFFQL
ncbi:MAG: TPD domain-containing protein [Thermoplasmata archaeon]